MANWKPLPDWEQTHLVSDQGEVWSCTRTLVNRNGVKRTWQGRALKPTPNSNGYLRVSVAKADAVPVAQAVLRAFVGPRPDGHVVMHLDNDPTNNALANLKWGTQAENIQQSSRDRTHKNARKTTCPRGHEYDTMNGVGRRCKRCHAANERRRRRERKLRMAGID